MSKGAATENNLGSLHSKITDVFQKILERYEARLDCIEMVTPEQIEDEMIREIFEDGALPNPAMLSAITKFLKDNEISFDSEQLNELSDTERRLQERRERRGNITSLTTLKAVGDD